MDPDVQNNTICIIENVYYFTEEEIRWERTWNKLEVEPAVFDVLLLASEHPSVSAQLSVTEFCLLSV
jgi:hypothetical protein